MPLKMARLYRKITLLFNQIEEHERFLQTILDSLWMELLVVDPNKRVIMVNKHFLTRHGQTEEDVLGRLYRSVSPPRAESAQCPLGQVLTSCKPITVVKQHQKKDQEKWSERHLTPILNGNGQVDFVVEAVNDITDQVLLEQEHSQRMKLQGVIEMAGTAAHQLHTPLFAALGTAQLLRDDLNTPEMIDVTGYSSSEYVGATRVVDLTPDEK